MRRCWVRGRCGSGLGTWGIGRGLMGRPTLKGLFSEDVDRNPLPGRGSVAARGCRPGGGGVHRGRRAARWAAAGAALRPGRWILAARCDFEAGRSAIGSAVASAPCTSAVRSTPETSRSSTRRRPTTCSCGSGPTPVRITSVVPLQGDRRAGGAAETADPHANKVSYPTGGRTTARAPRTTARNGSASPPATDGTELTIEHTPAADSVYYAYFAPYSLERHADLVANMQCVEGVTAMRLGASVDGRDVDLCRSAKVPGRRSGSSRGSTPASRWPSGSSRASSSGCSTPRTRWPTSCARGPSSSSCRT